MTDSILQTAAARLNYLGDVQNLLADNLANIDTPAYQPLSPVSFTEYLQNSGGSLPMLQNDANDLSGEVGAPVADSASIVSDHSPDGNAVSLDQQLVSMAKNETNQQFTTNLYQAYMGMYKTALGSSTG